MNLKKDNFLAKLIQNKTEEEVNIVSLFKESNGYTNKHGKSIMNFQYKGYSLYLASDRHYASESPFESLVLDIEKHLRIFEGLLSGTSSKYSPYEFVVNSLLVKESLLIADGSLKPSPFKKHTKPTRERILEVIDSNKFQKGWDYDFKDMYTDTHSHFSKYFDLA